MCGGVCNSVYGCVCDVGECKSVWRVSMMCEWLCLCMCVRVCVCMSVCVCMCVCECVYVCEWVG